MTKSQASPVVKTISMSIMVLLLVFGCQLSTFRPPRHEVVSGDNQTKNPACLPPPNVSFRFNVTGALTWAVNPNSSISLFVAPDPSFYTSLYVVEHCSAIIVRPIIKGVNFTFDDLPPGDYVGMVPIGSFFENIQGFPIVREYNRSNYTLKFNFYGGTPSYSVVSFSIRLKEDQKPKSNYS